MPTWHADGAGLHPPEFHEGPRAMADAIPNARTSMVGGGHLIDPASPEVLAFGEEVAASP